MGVLGFYKWALINGLLLTGSDPSLFKEFKSLNIDANALLYNTYNSLSDEQKQVLYNYHFGNEDERAKFLEVFGQAYIKQFENLINATRINTTIGVKALKYIYIAFDGQAPLGKINQQRKRRFLGAIKADNNDVLMSTVFSPGTKFMSDIVKYLKDNTDKLQKILKNPPQGTRKTVLAREYINNAEIIISGTEELGEGEIKIIKRLDKQQIAKGEHDIIVSNDADLYLLGMMRTGKNIVIMRAIDDYVYPDNGEVKTFITDRYMFIKTEHIKMKILDMYIHALVDYDNDRFTKLNENITVANYDTNYNQLTKAFLYAVFLSGNDFLPHASFIFGSSITLLLMAFFDYLIALVPDKDKKNSKQISSEVLAHKFFTGTKLETARHYLRYIQYIKQLQLDETDTLYKVISTPDYYNFSQDDMTSNKALVVTVKFIKNYLKTIGQPKKDVVLYTYRVVDDVKVYTIEEPTILSEAAEYEKKTVLTENYKRFIYNVLNKTFSGSRLINNLTQSVELMLYVKQRLSSNATYREYLRKIKNERSIKKVVSFDVYNHLDQINNDIISKQFYYLDITYDNYNFVSRNSISDIIWMAPNLRNKMAENNINYYLRVALWIEEYYRGQEVVYTPYYPDYQYLFDVDPTVNYVVAIEVGDNLTVDGIYVPDYNILHQLLSIIPKKSKNKLELWRAIVDWKSNEVRDKVLAAKDSEFEFMQGNKYQIEYSGNYYRHGNYNEYIIADFDFTVVRKFVDGLGLSPEQLATFNSLPLKLE